MRRSSKQMKVSTLPNSLSPELFHGLHVSRRQEVVGQFFVILRPSAMSMTIVVHKVHTLGTGLSLLGLLFMFIYQPTKVGIVYWAYGLPRTSQRIYSAVADASERCKELSEIEGATASLFIIFRWCREAKKPSRLSSDSCTLLLYSQLNSKLVANALSQPTLVAKLSKLQNYQESGSQKKECLESLVIGVSRQEGRRH